jgi:hypothetical protein
MFSGKTGHPGGCASGVTAIFLRTVFARELGTNSNIKLILSYDAFLEGTKEVTCPF